MLRVLGNLSTRHKFWLILLLSVIGLAALGMQALNELSHNLLEDRKVKTRHVVETAHGILNYFHAQETAGRMSGDDARTAAVAAIKAVRYGNGDYFWINDMQARMVMHPTNPKLDGQDLRQNVDPNGKRLFIAFVDTVKQHGAGFVDYLWPKPGHEHPVAKVSYVMGFEPWGWIIGSGLYLDDIDTIFWRHAQHLGLGSLLIIAVLIVLALLVLTTLTGPLEQLRSVIGTVRDTGNLSQRASIERRDEIGMMATAFDRLLEGFCGFVRGVNQSIEALADAGLRLQTVTAENHQSVAQAKSQAERITGAMQEMTQTVEHIARDASAAAMAARTAETETATGRTVVNATVTAIDQLAREIDTATEVIQMLSADSDNIGKVLEVIRGVAEQTNLLALNAAIEAARAGEQGRGFAVVAAEVRTLASRTQESTRDIQQIIETLQHRCRNAVTAMTVSRNQSQISVEQATQAGVSLATITEAVAHISTMNQRIAHGAEEQSAVAGEITANLAAITREIDRTTECARQTASAGEDLRQLAHRLEERVEQFHC